MSSHAASILLIDDNFSTLETFSALLRSEGFSVATAGNAQQGITAASEESFDLILVDQRLPDLPGSEVVRTLRTSGIRGVIIVITAFPDLESSFDAGSAGADGYVEGPLFQEELFDIISMAMQGQLPVRHPIKAFENGVGGACSTSAVKWTPGFVTPYRSLSLT